MNAAVDSHPRLSHRLAAVGSFVSATVAIALLIVVTIDDPHVMIATAVLLAAATAGAWIGLTRRSATRIVGVVAAVAALVAVVVIIFLGEDMLPLMVILGLWAIALPLARFALARDRASLALAPTPGVPVPAAVRPVLIMNLKSGGGKADRFGLADACRARGIEPVILQPGDDLAQLAEAAIDRGADVIGMAGGDGSQALVAEVAARRGIPHVVVPAGTRNHFALDLGLDRDDVVGALDAFGTAVERRIDLADVNGHVFVNNVALGAYAQVVQSDDYRDAKIATTLSELPDLLGPNGQPSDLGWTGPDGVHRDSAHLILVSNNPYSMLVGGGAGTRRHIDTGTLGVIVLDVQTTGAAVALATAVALHVPERASALVGWAASTFEVTSGDTVAAGIDGEAVQLTAPVCFRSLPGALVVRLPDDAPGLSPAAIAGTSGAATLRNVWRVACGHAPQPPAV